MSAAIEARGSRTDRGQAAVALAAIVWSTAGVLQRQLSVGVATQMAGRALFAAVAVAAYVAVAERGRVRAACRSVGGAGVGFAASVAVSSGAFIVSLNHASVAQVLFIQSIAPVLAALLGRALLGESLSGRTAMAMAVAVLGVGVMVGSPGGGSALGDGLSVLMALGFAVAIVIARHRSDVSMAPATGLAQWRDRGRGRRPPGPRPSGAAARQSRRDESGPSRAPSPLTSHARPRDPRT